MTEVNEAFSVRVPASTSNLGSGFDTVSAALSLYLTLQVEPTDGDRIEWVQGPDSGPSFSEKDNLIARSLNEALSLVGIQPPGLRIQMNNPVPLKRGLGSSAAAIIAGIKIAETISGSDLDTEQIFQVAYPLEGHPDNLSASLLGGWVLSWISDQRMQAEKLPASLSCRFVLAIPETTISTNEARAILPKEYSLGDATHNVQRCALLIHALNSGRKDLLREATSDRLHQSFRAQLVPGIQQLIELEDLDAELSDSLLGISISGSGSAVVALVDDHEEEIGGWMVKTLAAQDTQAGFQVLDLDTVGAQVLPHGDTINT